MKVNPATLQDLHQDLMQESYRANPGLPLHAVFVLYSYCASIPYPKYPAVWRTLSSVTFLWGVLTLPLSQTVTSLATFLVCTALRRSLHLKGHFTAAYHVLLLRWRCLQWFSICRSSWTTIASVGKTWNLYYRMLGLSLRHPSNNSPTYSLRAMQ